MACKWTVPTFTTAKLPPAAPERELLVKMAADILEALIGAAYVDGGMSLAWLMIHLFFPSVVKDTHPSIGPCPDKNLSPIPIAPACLDDHIDSLVGYHFIDRSLIWEALTHFSWQRDMSTGFRQRLVFLGDALLDLIIDKRVFAHTPAMEESAMTQTKAALVNAHFLVFLCVEHNLVNTYVSSNPKPPQREESDTTATEKTLELWRFTRFGNPDILITQHAFFQRLAQLQGPIHDQLVSGATFPWGLLTQLRAERCYSGVIESIVGAIFVDTHGNIDECEKFLARIGLIADLDRVLKEGVVVDHPRSRLSTMAGSRKVEVHSIQSEGDVKAAGVGFSITLDGEQLASVQGCFTKDEAVVRAAELAVEILRLYGA